MRLFAGNENSLLPVSVPLIQSFVETEDVLKAMRKYIKPDGFIENMFIEFENTKIPICSQHECRIVAHMAAAYHNSCLAKTLSSEKDLYGNAYTPQNTLDSEDQLFWMKQDAKISSEEITNKKTNKRQFQKPHKKSHQADDSWDEDVHGERVVYDTTYEMNENLVPWLMRPGEWEDKYGLY